MRLVGLATMFPKQTLCLPPTLPKIAANIIVLLALMCSRSPDAEFATNLCHK
jgi:hypothetical protein